jgi:hypothetical protein
MAIKPITEGKFMAMSELLQRAIAELEKLPEDEQNAIAARLLAELEDEQAWAARFEATTDEQWDRLAASARQEISTGDTASLEEVFPKIESDQ